MMISGMGMPTSQRSALFIDDLLKSLGGENVERPARFPHGSGGVSVSGSSACGKREKGKGSRRWLSVT